MTVHRVWQESRGALLFLGLMLVFRSSVADWVRVPTGSMNPTIIEGDRVLVDKRAYGIRVPFTLEPLIGGPDPRRGDIVVFDSPADGQSLVKRVVGVPGDTVELRGETLVVNGVRAHYGPGNDADLGDLPARTAAMGPRVVHEELLGVGHDLLLLPDRTGVRSLAPVTVPAGEFLVLGDSRDNSADSRYFGFVPRRNFVGRVSRVVVSLDPEHAYLPRPARTLRPIG